MTDTTANSRTRFGNAPHDAGVSGRGRLTFIDVTRGLLILWMVLAHALTVSGIGRDSLLFYVRPPGWSTHGFVMLSGFSLATVIIGRGFSGPAMRRRLARRAGQLLAVALATELASRAARWLIDGRTAPVLALFDPSAHWSISAVLLPPAALFGIAAVVAPHLRAPRPLEFVALLVGLGALIDLLGPVSADYGLHWLVEGGVLGFPVLTFVVLAFLGLGLGLVAQRLAGRWFAPAGAAVGALLLGLQELGILGWPVLYYLSTFLLPLGAVIVLGGQFEDRVPVRALALMGRSALLVFVLHRPVLHFGAWALQGLDSRAVRFWVLTWVTVALLAAACAVKERYPKVQPILRKAGF